MKIVELSKGIDYRGHGVFVKKGQKLTVEDSKADELVATGFFSRCGEATSLPNTDSDDELDAKGDKQEEADESSKGNKPVAKMNAEELRAYAESKGYDISECTKTSEIKALIIELDAKGDE
jgi:hypothetical protein